MDAGEPLRIERAALREQVEALWLLLTALPEPHRRDRIAGIVRDVTCGLTSLDHLLIARRAGVIRGVIWAQCRPGASAELYPPVLIPDEAAATADLLQQSLDERLAHDGVATVQALVLQSDAPTSAESTKEPGLPTPAFWARHQYQWVATLAHLRAPRERFPSEPPPLGLSCEPYSEWQQQRLESLVIATYAESLDAPAVDGSRTPTEILAGYRATGHFAPERWFLARADDRDVGCLLLTDHPAIDHWELVYVGLIPEVRGRGWGLELVRYALWLARKAGRAGILVCVDAANHPAVAVYERLGFQELDRFQLWFKNLRTAPDPAARRDLGAGSGTP